jgi:glutathione S-transferase
MIELYKFGGTGKICDPSPFCAKVETYLKMAELPYESHNGMKYLKAAPKGKLPYIKDQGEVIADSAFILAHLEQKYNHILDGHLSDEQKAMAHAFTKMIDENLYWVLVFSRWGLEDNWLIIKERFFGKMPFPLKMFVPNMIRKKVIKGMFAHGIGRHSETEITEIGCQDLLSLSDMLAEKEYFFGEKPSTLDATAYGILSQFMLSDEFTAPIVEKAQLHQNLVDYTHRIYDKYFT